MPELPEVETVRRGLAPVMEGARIVKMEARRPDLRRPLPKDFAERVEGKTVTGIGRRAKYLTVDLSSGDVLLMHLGMSGSFRVESTDASMKTRREFRHERSKNPRHDHVVLHLDNGKIVTYNDPRRFGFMDLAASDALDAHPRLRELGDDALASNFDAARLAKLFAGARAPLKAGLLDQKRIAGLGNIYVCEALFRARLSPLRPAGVLAHASGAPTRAARALALAIRRVLEEAIEAGGSTLRDHRLADGGLGYFQHSFAVYDREGEPCLRPRCRGTITRKAQSGRSTFYCPNCQK